MSYVCVTNFTCLSLLFKLSKHMNLIVLWAYKSKSPNRRNPLKNMSNQRKRDKEKAI